MNPNAIGSDYPVPEDTHTRALMEAFMGKVERMRTAQRDYFARRQETDKKIAMALEVDVDVTLRRLRARFPLVYGPMAAIALDSTSILSRTRLTNRFAMRLVWNARRA